MEAIDSAWFFTYIDKIVLSPVEVISGKFAAYKRSLVHGNFLQSPLKHYSQLLKIIFLYLETILQVSLIVF